MSEPLIGRVPFTDGCERAVYRSGDGRQYVIDGAGLRVFGTWVLVDDGELEAPAIVAPSCRNGGRPSKA